jgi:hypothetical protein
MASFCKYLEAAPNLWEPYSQSACSKTGSACGGTSNDQTTSDFSGTGKGITWCTATGPGANFSGLATSTAIGMGYANTTAMVGVCNSYDAGNVARSYNGGGLNDWSLGSWDEMSALYSYQDRAAIGGFNSGQYWTSNVMRGAGITDAITLFFDNRHDGKHHDQSRTYPEGLRPTRAF